MRPFVTTTLKSLRSDAEQLRAVLVALRPGRPSRWVKAAWCALCTFWLLAVASGSAHALYATAGDATADPGSTSVYDSLSTATDSHGLALSDYTLSTAEGGVREPIVAISSFLLTFAWDCYRLGVGVAMWLLETLIEFTWLDLLRVPAQALANVLESVTGDLGLVPALVTVSVLLSGFLMLSGRVATAFGEIAITAVVAGLFTTALVNPVDMIAGDAGLIAQSKELGVSLSNQMMGTEDPTTGEMTLPTGELMEVMVRIPHQYVNYATYIDRAGGSCVDAYDKLLADGGEYGDLGDACPDSAVETAENPASAMPVMMLAAPGATLLVFFTIVLAMCLALVVSFMLWEAAKFVWEMVKALIPGSARAGLIQGGINLMVGAGLVVGGMMAVALYVMVLVAAYDATGDWDPVGIFVFVDVLMLVAVVAIGMYFLRGRGQGKALGKKTSDALNRRPASVAPASRTAQIARAGAMKAGAYAAGHATARLGERHSAPSATSVAAGRSSTGKDSGGKGRPTAATIARGAAKATGTAAKIGVKATLGATVLAPVEVPRAARAAKKAADLRKAAMQKRLAAAKSSAGKKVDQVTDYGREYAHNVKTARDWSRKTFEEFTPGEHQRHKAGSGSR